MSQLNDKKKDKNDEKEDDEDDEDESEGENDDGEEGEEDDDSDEPEEPKKTKDVEMTKQTKKGSARDNKHKTSSADDKKDKDPSQGKDAKLTDEKNNDHKENPSQNSGKSKEKDSPQNNDTKDKDNKETNGPITKDTKDNETWNVPAVAIATAIAAATATVTVSATVPPATASNKGKENEKEDKEKAKIKENEKERESKGSNTDNKEVKDNKESKDNKEKEEKHNQVDQTAIKQKEQDKKDEKDKVKDNKESVEKDKKDEKGKETKKDEKEKEKENEKEQQIQKQKEKGSKLKLINRNRQGVRFDDLIMAQLRILKYDKLFRIINVLMFVFAIIPLGLTIATNEICWDNADLVLKGKSDCITGEILRCVSWGSTLVFVGLLISYYYLESRRKAEKWNIEKLSASFFHTELYYRFIIELGIGVVQPIPFVEHKYGIETKIIIGMFLRFYFLIRVLRDYSSLYRNRYQLRTLSKFDHPAFEVGTMNILKVYFLRYTTQFIFIVFACVLTSLAYIIYILERGWWIPKSGTSNSAVSLSETPSYSHDDLVTNYQQSEFTSYRRSLWFTCATMTTVGYGDMIPSSWEGRMMAMITAILGLTVMSTLVSVLTIHNRLSPFEAYCYEWMVIGDVLTNKYTPATQIIASTYRYYQGKKKRILARHAIDSNGEMTEVKRAEEIRKLGMEERKARDTLIESHKPLLDKLHSAQHDEIELRIKMEYGSGIGSKLLSQMPAFKLSTGRYVSSMASYRPSVVAPPAAVLSDPKTQAQIDVLIKLQQVQLEEMKNEDSILEKKLDWILTALTDNENERKTETNLINQQIDMINQQIRQNIRKGVDIMNNIELSEIGPVVVQKDQKDKKNNAKEKEEEEEEEEEEEAAGPSSRPTTKRIKSKEKRNSTLVREDSNRFACF